MENATQSLYESEERILDDVTSAAKSYARSCLASSIPVHDALMNRLAVMLPAWIADSTLDALFFTYVRAMYTAAKDA